MTNDTPIPPGVSEAKWRKFETLAMEIYTELQIEKGLLEARISAITEKLKRSKKALEMVEEAKLLETKEAGP